MKTMKFSEFLISATMLAAVSANLAGCGGDNAAATGANGVSQASAPAGSSSSGVTTPVTTPSPSTSPSSGATRPVINIPVQGYGPAKTTSTYIDKPVGTTPSSSFTIDGSFRVRMNFGDATGGTGGAYTHNYSTIRATIGLLVNGVERNAITLTVGNGASDSQGFPRSAIADFSATAFSYINNSTSAKQISIRVRNIQTDYKLRSGGCLNEYVLYGTSLSYAPAGATCTAYSGCITDWYGTRCQKWQCRNGFVYNGQYYVLDSGTYNTCLTRATPVGDVQDTQGWSFTLDAEPSGAQL